MQENSLQPTIIKNATVWTNEDEGILQNTDIINDGKIIIGKDPIKRYIEYKNSHKLLMLQVNTLRNY